MSKEQEEMEDLWDHVSELRPVRDFMNMNWHHYLPPAVGTTFYGVAMAAELGLEGDPLWRQMEEFVKGILRAIPTPEQKSRMDQMEKQFSYYYGPYERTAHGLVGVLADLGLVTLEQRDGQDAVEIPQALPDPVDRLGIARCDLAKSQPLIFKAKHRGAGPRIRTWMEDVPAIERMLDAGWARHLPPDIGQAFMAAAAISLHCAGDLMWDNIEDVWKAQMDHPAPFMPKKQAQEVEARFAAEYGRSYEKTARGAIAVLLDLGLLVLGQVNGDEHLQVPDILPSPDAKLILSDEEKELLNARRNAKRRNR